ncbi:MAG: hypothetical protein ACJASY_001717 [Halioglobus sp.]|jgi:hypothetical protein
MTLLVAGNAEVTAVNRDNTLGISTNCKISDRENSDDNKKSKNLLSLLSCLLPHGGNG